MSSKPKAPPPKGPAPSDTVITSLPSEALAGATSLTSLPEEDPKTFSDMKALDLPEPAPRHDATRIEPPPTRRPTREVPLGRKPEAQAGAGGLEGATDPQLSADELRSKAQARGLVLPQRDAETDPGPPSAPQTQPTGKLRRSELAVDAPRGPVRRRTQDQETAAIRVEDELASLPPRAEAGAPGTGLIRVGRRRVLPGERPDYLPRWAPLWSEPFFALEQPAKLKVVGGVAAGLVLLTFLYQLARPATARGPVARSDDSGVARLVAEGRTAIAEKRYDAAAAALEAASRLDPDNEEVRRYSTFASKTRDEKALLDRALRALEGKRYPEAREALRQIPPESEFGDQARANLAGLDEEEARYLLDQAEGHLKAGEVERAAEALEPLAKLKPALAEQLTKELAEARAGRGPGSAPPAGQGQARPRAPAQPSDAELQAGFAAFAEDPAKGADAFDQLARGGKGATQKRAAQLAVLARACDAAQARAGRELEAMEKAVASCAEVSPDAPVVGRLRDAVVERAHQQAEEAAAAEDRGKEAQAYRHILAVKPGDGRAQRELKRLVDKAHELYMQGYVNGERDPDGAVRDLREALTILTPQDADYPRVKAKLAELRH